MDKELDIGDHVYYRDKEFRQVRTGKIRTLNKSWCDSRLMTVNITKDEEMEDSWRQVERSVPKKNVLGLVRDLEE
jgi:hypothetical protein